MPLLLVLATVLARPSAAALPRLVEPMRVAVVRPLAIPRVGALRLAQGGPLCAAPLPVLSLVPKPVAILFSAKGAAPEERRLGLAAAFDGALPVPRPTAGGDLDALDRTLSAMQADFDRSPARPADKGWARRKLAHMTALDQTLRKSLPDQLEPSTLLRFAWVDERNARDLKEVLAAHGWPTIGAFGAEADFDAWLLVQHADRDLAFQKAVLSILADLYPKGETRAANYAYLYDRVAAAEGRPQRYGTQLRLGADGMAVPSPLEDPDGVDARRKAVGLEPLAKYLKRSGNR